jgi:RNA-directed DNA polymerase
MRVVAPGSFARCTSVAALWRAWQDHARGKRRKPTVAAFGLEADARVLALHRALRAGSYTPQGFRPMVVRDPKLRLIAVPSVVDRIVHHAVVSELRPVLDRRLVHACYASREGKGSQRAVLAYLRHVRRHRHRLSLDVRRYFPSIDHAVLLEEIVLPRVRDSAMAQLLRALVGASEGLYQSALAVEVLGLQGEPVPPGVGLPIGSSLSQWAANLYLDGLDHFVLRELKVPGYLRYMDDFVLFHDDAGRLVEARTAIEAWLLRERRLRLNPKRWAVHRADEPSVFLGYRVTRGGVAPGKKLMRRLRGKVRAAAGRGVMALERTVASYRGLVGFG